jgi:hypothetical protein
MEKLAQAFALLDAWRHLPAYQLERRADIFFALYMKEVIASAAGALLRDEIIPEFPIKRDLIWPEKPSKRPLKVDYVLFAKDGSRVYFVELKTDQWSRRRRQDEYLERARALGFRPILSGLLEVARATKAYTKYHHLLCTLERLGFLTLPSDLPSYLYPAPRRGLGKRWRAITLANRAPVIEVLYVQPRSDGDARCIGFDSVIEHVLRHDDPVSRLFATYLERWREGAATAAPVELETEPA